MLRPKSILHPTDLSSRSAYAFELARSLARENGAKLTLLHVLPSVGADAARRRAEQALAMLDQVNPNLILRWTILAGDVADNILWMANEFRFDLIVLAARERVGFESLVSRSVSRSVVRRAPCPVIRVNAPLAWLPDQADRDSRCIDSDSPANLRTDSPLDATAAFATMA